MEDSPRRINTTPTTTLRRVEPVYAFYLKLDRAEQQAADDYLGVIHRAATGTIERTTKTTQGIDANGGTYTSTVITEREVADWRAAAFWLERRDPAHVGKLAVEVTNETAVGELLPEQVGELVAALVARYTEELAARAGPTLAALIDDHAADAWTTAFTQARAEAHPRALPGVR